MVHEACLAPSNSCRSCPVYKLHKVPCSSGTNMSVQDIQCMQAKACSHEYTRSAIRQHACCSQSNTAHWHSAQLSNATTVVVPQLALRDRTAATADAGHDTEQHDLHECHKPCDLSICASTPTHHCVMPTDENTSWSMQTCDMHNGFSSTTRKGQHDGQARTGEFELFSCIWHVSSLYKALCCVVFIISKWLCVIPVD